MRRSWAPILRSVVAVTLGLGLSAIYLVPAAVEQHWVQIRQATDDPGLAIENSFLFGHHTDPNLELHDVELWRVSAIAVIMIGLALLSIFIAWRRGLLRRRTWWIPLALIPLSPCFFCNSPSRCLLWNVAAQTALSAISLALACRTSKHRSASFLLRPSGRRGAGCASSSSSRLLLVFLFITAVTTLLFHQDCDAEDAVVGMLSAYRGGQGFEGDRRIRTARARTTH